MAVETSPPPADVERRPPAPRVDLVALALLALGHAVTDSYGWTLMTPMGPDLQHRLGITLGEWGLLATVMGLSASLFQPLLGLLSDRRPRWCLVALGPMLAAFFISRVYLATHFWALALTLFGAGVGIGAFHPQGAMLARRAGRGSGLAMSAFTVGGNIGFGLAPTLGLLYLLWFGPERFFLTALPALVYGAAMLFVFYRRGYFGGPLMGAPSRRELPPGQSNKPALALLTATVIVRSAVQQGLVTFLPFLVVERLGAAGGAGPRVVVVTTLLFASAFAGPIGGHLADRFGRRRLMFWSFALAPAPLLGAMLGPPALLLPLLAVGGFILMMPHPSNVVMAQEFLPRQTGIGASMITGFGWGVALLIMKPLGDFGAAESLRVALAWLCALPWAGVLLTWRLPEAGHVETTAARRQTASGKVSRYTQGECDNRRG